MRSLSVDELKTLWQFTNIAFPCISIYIPTHRHHPEAAQDPIRFKNTLRAVEHQMTETGVSPAKLKALLRPAQDLLDNAEFWKYQSDGLAVFIAQDFFRHYRMPVRVPELMVVTRRFHLKPMLSLLSQDKDFFILALSQKTARLFEASLAGATEITPADFPGGVQAILELYDPSQQLQSHTAAGGVPGSHGSIFHGQGGGIDDLKHRITEYFREIDRVLVRELGRSQAPLVLAAVDYLLPMYRDVNTYTGLVEAGIIGNPDLASAEDLYRSGWSIVGPLFQKVRQEAEEKYQTLSTTARTSRDLREILAAAHHGRIESLFVAVGVQLWGSFEPNSESINVHEECGPEDEDLLDLAAFQSLTKGGAVFAVDPTAVPGHTKASAVFRY